MPATDAQKLMTTEQEIRAVFEDSFEFEEEEENSETEEEEEDDSVEEEAEYAIIETQEEAAVPAQTQQLEVVQNMEGARKVVTHER